MELTPEQQQAIEQQKQNCPFCQIVAGNIQAHKVYEDDKIVAVLDINPASKGHLLVMPKEHYPIMPLIPPEEFAHLAQTTREIAKYTRDALLAPLDTVFIANGQAAGQQSQHFLLHVIPQDKRLSNFQLPSKEQNQEQIAELGRVLKHNAAIMMGGSPPASQPAPIEPPSVDQLAELIEQNPDLKQAIIDKPEAVLAGLEDNPTLKPVFEGVDMMALSAKLKELQGTTEVVPEPQAPPAKSEDDVPSAMALTDEQLIAFVESKPKLKELLYGDLNALKEAIPMQPRLQIFFMGTSPEQVRLRLIPQDGSERKSRFGGS